MSYFLQKKSELSPVPTKSSNTNFFEKRPTVQKKSDEFSKKNSKGLAGNVKSKMENSFNTDFSNVEVHENSAEPGNQNAVAFARGNEVHFAPQMYQPNNPEGQELIGHELTHVVQQRGVKDTELQGKGLVHSDSKLEQEADVNGAKSARGRKVDVKGKANTNNIQKKALTPAEKVELRRLAGNRIDKSYTDFIDAANQVKEEIHKAVQAERDFIFFLADIALSYLLPGASKVLANYADKIPNAASNTAFRVALSLLDEAKTTKHLTTATKFGTRSLKNNYSKITNIAKIDGFIAALKTQTRDGFDKTDASLSGLSDTELGVVYLAFSTALTNAETYKVQIRKTIARFKSQVVEIGNKAVGNVTIGNLEYDYQTGLVWWEYKSGKYVLAKVRVMNERKIGRQQSTKIYFKELIDQDMSSLSLKMGKATQPNGVIKPMNLSLQKRLKGAGLLFNSPSSFPKGKHYK